jgi:hypothetical protein
MSFNLVLTMEVDDKRSTDVCEFELRFVAPRQEIGDMSLVGLTYLSLKAP